MQWLPIPSVPSPRRPVLLRLFSVLLRSSWCTRSIILHDVAARPSPGFVRSLLNATPKLSDRIGDVYRSRLSWAARFVLVKPWRESSDTLTVRLCQGPVLLHDADGFDDTLYLLSFFPSIQGFSSPPLLLALHIHARCEGHDSRPGGTNCIIHDDLPLLLCMESYDTR